MSSIEKPASQGLSALYFDSYTWERENGILSENQQWHRAEQKEKHIKPSKNSWKIQVQRMLDFISPGSKSATYSMWLITDLFSTENGESAFIGKFSSTIDWCRLAALSTDSHKLHASLVFREFWVVTRIFSTPTRAFAGSPPLDACVRFSKESLSNKNSYLL